MLVLGTWFSLRAADYSSEELAFKVTLIKVADLALMVYITNYVLIPFLLYRKRYFLFALVFIAMVFASSIIKMNILGQLLQNPALINWQQNFRLRLYDNIIPHFFLVIAGAAVQLMLDYGRLQQRMATIAKEKAEAELNFLKSQINPHFVFNSLNAVYFLIHKDNAPARETLHKFSEMLRYQLYEMNGDKVPIEKEVSYLKDYCDLQQLRKDENYAVSFQADPSVKGFMIEPLLLLPFIENAFKHISHYRDKTNFVEVGMHYVAGKFSVTIANSMEQEMIHEQAGGIGLSNVKRRLQLLYPGKHELVITNQNEVFSVQLNLLIHEN